MSEDEPHRKLPSGEFEVEPWMSYLWADGTGNEDNIFRYEEEAQKIGEDTQLVPPEFAMIIAREGIGLDNEEIFDDMEFDWDSGVYHGKQGFEFHQPLKTNMAYSVSGEVSSIERKEGDSGEFDIATVTYDIANPDGDLVCETYKKLILMRS